MIWLYLCFSILVAIYGGFLVFLLRQLIIDRYKIGYYEQKLESRGIFIQHVKRVKLREILRGDVNVWK